MATDERRVICEDAGDRLVIRTIEGSVEVFIEDIVDGGKRPGEVFISDDKVAVAAAFVDALGLECDGFRAKARPFQVGDRIKVSGLLHEWTVVAVGEHRLFARGWTGTTEEAWDIDRCTLITPAEEVEQGEVEQSEGEWRTPEVYELAAARRAGVLEVWLFDAWVSPTRSPESYERYGFNGVAAGTYRVPAGWSA